MDRFVLNVFKGIMISMILIFVFDILSYLYRAISVDQRMLNIMTGMQRVVMENNYLPSEAEQSYEEIFTALADNYNEYGADAEEGSTSTNYTNNVFINWVKLNYGNPADGDFSGISNLHTDMKVAGEYGDIMVVQASINIKQPIWGFNNQINTHEGAKFSMNNFNREGYSGNTFTYTYLVPCLHYQRI